MSFLCEKFLNTIVAIGPIAFGGDAPPVYCKWQQSPKK